MVQIIDKKCRMSALTHNKNYRKGGSCVKISVTKGGKVTRNSTLEYTEPIRLRYLRASKAEKNTSALG
jgi:hypothetical protein